MSSTKTKLSRNIRPLPSVEDRFSVARSHLKSIGIILPFYSSVIRAINSAPAILKTKDAASVDAFAVASALLPVRISPTLTESFKSAAAEFYPKKFDALRKSGTTDIKSVLKLFSANEISSILGITYFFKILSKCCDIQEFSRISPMLSIQLRQGALVGAQSASNFGRGGGIAVSGLRILALAVFIKTNLKAFKKYRRLIEDSGELNHVTFEMENFGCTHLDVASILAGDLGFGPIAREAFINYQLGRSKSSSTEGIYWNHTLKETSKLWSERHAQMEASATKDKTASDFSDGYRWLWGQKASGEILPGVELEEIAALIPDQSSQEPSILLNAEEKDPTTDLSILIVEDDEMSARILEKHLSSLGTFTVRANAESVMPLISAPMQSLPFDLILLDINLPGKSGLDLLNSIREIEQKMALSPEASCKIFMITGDGTPQTVMQAFSHGANGYLTKPLNREEIRAELSKHEIYLAKPKKA